MSNSAWKSLRLPASVWTSEPKAERVGNLITYKMESGLPGTTPFYLSFVMSNNRWLLAHVESIRIPLEVPECPVSAFPDLDEDTKAFMREEIAVTNQIRFFNHLRDEAGWNRAHEAGWSVAIYDERSVKPADFDKAWESGWESGWASGQPVRFEFRR